MMFRRLMLAGGMGALTTVAWGIFHVSTNEFCLILIVYNNLFV
jgi:hypothetical protein